MADYLDIYFSKAGNKLSQTIANNGDINIKLPLMNDKIIFFKPTSSDE